jgi:hypothetical protein
MAGEERRYTRNGGGGSSGGGARGGDQQGKPKRVKIGALWESTTQNGQVYYAGSFGRGGGARLEVWPNRYKTEEKHPDFNVFVVEPLKRDGDGGGRDE